LLGAVAVPHHMVPASHPSFGSTPLGATLSGLALAAR
jgi:hypothetical protein